MFSGSNNLAQRQCQRVGRTRKQHLLAACPVLLISPQESCDWKDLRASLLSSEVSMITCLQFFKSRTQCCPLLSWSDLRVCLVGEQVGESTLPAVSNGALEPHEQRPVLENHVWCHQVSARPVLWGRDRSPKTVQNRVHKRLWRKDPWDKIHWESKKGLWFTRNKAHMHNSTGEICFFSWANEAAAGLFSCSFFHSFYKYLWSTYCAPNIVLCSGDTEWRRQSLLSLLSGEIWQAINKQIRKCLVCQVVISAKRHRECRSGWARVYIKEGHTVKVNLTRGLEEVQEWAMTNWASVFRARICLKQQRR